MNETQTGLTLPVFAIELTLMRISKPKLRNVVFEAQLYDPESAIRLGFLDEVTEPDQIMARATEFATQFAQYSADTYAKNETAVLTDAVKSIRSRIGSLT